MLFEYPLKRNGRKKNYMWNFAQVIIIYHQGKCPDFFSGHSGPCICDATPPSPCPSRCSALPAVYLYLLTNNIIVLTFEVGLEISMLFVACGSIVIPGKNFRRNERRHHQKPD